MARADALKHVSIAVPAQRGDRNHRAVGLRQVNPAAHINRIFELYPGAARRRVRSWIDGATSSTAAIRCPTSAG